MAASCVAAIDSRRGAPSAAAEIGEADKHQFAEHVATNVIAPIESPQISPVKTCKQPVLCAAVSLDVAHRSHRPIARHRQDGQSN